MGLQANQLLDVLWTGLIPRGWWTAPASEQILSIHVHATEL